MSLPEKMTLVEFTEFLNTRADLRRLIRDAGSMDPLAPALYAEGLRIIEQADGSEWVLRPQVQPS